MIHDETFFHIKELSAYVRDFLTEETLLFDIETTGLSPARGQIYCIGCGYLKGDKIRLELLFAEGPGEEADLIGYFLDLVRTHPALVTFNGTTFDIPFIKKRASLLAVSGQELYAVSDDPDPSGPAEPDGACLPGARSHLDIYQEVRRLRKLLGLSSCRQKDIERFLGVDREDIYSGGELIRFYLSYVRTGDPSLLKPMLLHNREDVAGMFSLLGILAYRQFADGDFQITDVAAEYPEKAATVSAANGTAVGSLNIKIELRYPLSQSIRYIPEEKGSGSDARYGISFIPGRGSSLIRIPVYRGELKHFFDDPENYFYLPDEDEAVHKSIGQFVDPAHRRKATKRTCFTKKVCDYVSLPAGSGHTTGSKTGPGCPGYLKKDYDDRDICLEIPADTECLKASLCACFSRIK